MRSDEDRAIRQSFRATRAERWLWAIGIGATTILIAEALFLLTSSDLIGPMLAMVGAGLVLGREAGIPVGLASGLPPWLVWQISATADIASGFLMFGAFVHMMRRSEANDGRLGAWLRRLETEAEGRRGFVERWGPPGVFLFMLVPFLVNGPLVAAVLGRLGGLRTRQLIFPMIGATALAAALWVVFSGVFLQLTSQIQPGLEIAITAIFIGAMVALSITRQLWARWRAKRESVEDDESAEPDTGTATPAVTSFADPDWDASEDPSAPGPGPQDDESDPGP